MDVSRLLESHKRSIAKAISTAKAVAGGNGEWPQSDYIQVRLAALVLELPAPALVTFSDPPCGYSCSPQCSKILLTESEIAARSAALDGSSSYLWPQSCNSVPLGRIENLVRSIILTELVL